MLLNIPAIRNFIFLLLYFVGTASADDVRQLNLAVIQSESSNGEIATNLATAEVWVEKAVQAGAEFILLPEFLPTGYELTETIWQAAETMDGLTIQWMQRLSASHQIWMGTSFLEIENGEYYNSFVLSNPKGEIAGKVRKEIPASAEAYFFRGEANPHYIDTEIGRIGVMICYETALSKIANKIAKANVDLLLMPFSYPVITNLPGDYAQPLAGEVYASVYSEALGVPAAAVNKVGAWESGVRGMPGFKTKGFFPGLSALANGEGKIVGKLDDKAGFKMATVLLNPKLKKSDLVFDKKYVSAIAEHYQGNKDKNQRNE